MKQTIQYFREWIANSGLRAMLFFCCIINLLFFDAFARQPTTKDTPSLTANSNAQKKPEQAGVEWIENWTTNTPEGQEFWSLIESGEKNEQWGHDVLGDMVKGFSYDEAKKRRGLIAMPKRVTQDVTSALGEVEKLLRDPTRIPSEYLKGRDAVRKKVPILKHSGIVGTGVLVAWNVGTGLLVGLAE